MQWMRRSRGSAACYSGESGWQCPNSMHLAKSNFRKLPAVGGRNRLCRNPSDVRPAGCGPNCSLRQAAWPPGTPCGNGNPKKSQWARAGRLPCRVRSRRATIRRPTEGIAAMTACKTACKLECAGARTTPSESPSFATSPGYMTATAGHIRRIMARSSATIAMVGCRSSFSRFNFAKTCARIGMSRPRRRN